MKNTRLRAEFLLRERKWGRRVSSSLSVFCLFSSSAHLSLPSSHYNSNHPLRKRFSYSRVKGLFLQRGCGGCFWWRQHLFIDGTSDHRRQMKPPLDLSAPQTRGNDLSPAAVMLIWQHSLQTCVERTNTQKYILAFIHSHIQMFSDRQTEMMCRKCFISKQTHTSDGVTCKQSDKNKSRLKLK